MVIPILGLNDNSKVHAEKYFWNAITEEMGQVNQFLDITLVFDHPSESLHQPLRAFGIVINSYCMHFLKLHIIAQDSHN